MIGIGGLAKSIVGFLAGVIGQQFIVTAALPRLVMFVAATAVHAAVFMGLYVLLGLRTFPSPWAAVASQALGNAVVGMIGVRHHRVACPGMERAAHADGDENRRQVQAVRSQAKSNRSQGADRRSRRIGSSPADGAPGGRRRGVRRARHQLLVPADRPARTVRGDGGEQPSADARAAGAARRAVRPQRQGPGREPQSFSISIVREHTKDLDRTTGCWRRSPDSTSSRSADRRSASRRADVPADRRHRGRVARAGGRDHRAAARFRAAGRRGRASADAAVPDRRAGRAPVRLRRRGQRRAGRRRHHERRHRRPVGHRTRLQPAADGPGRRPARGRQQHGPRDRELEEIPPTEGRACS